MYYKMDLTCDNRWYTRNLTSWEFVLKTIYKNKGINIIKDIKEWSGETQLL